MGTLSVGGLSERLWGVVEMVSAARQALVLWSIISVGLVCLLGPLAHVEFTGPPFEPWHGVVMWFGVLVVGGALALAGIWGPERVSDEGSSEVVGVVLLVGFVMVGASGAFLAVSGGEELPVEASVVFRPVDAPPYGGGFEGVEAVAVEVSRLDGADRANGSLRVGSGVVPWTLVKGSVAVVECPPEGVPISVVVGSEVVAWSNALPCHVEAADGQDGSEDRGDEDSDGGEECPLVSVELVAYQGGSVRESSATFEVEVCDGDLA